MGLEFVVTRTHGNRGQIRIFGGVLVCEQCNHTVRRCRSKDDVRGFFKDRVEIEHRTQRLTHFIKCTQNVGLALERFEHFVALW